MSSDPSQNQPSTAGYGHPSMPQPATPVPGRKGPLAMLLSGVGLGIIGFVVVLIATFTGIGGLMNSVSEQERLPAGEPISIATEADATYGIFLAGSTNIQCYAENDAGAPVSLSVPSYQSQVNNREQVLLMETGPADTNVTIQCLTNDEGDYFVGKTVGSALGGMTTPVIAGIILMGLGTVAVIAGIIWLVIRQGQIKQARARA